MSKTEKTEKSKKPIEARMLCASCGVAQAEAGSRFCDWCRAPRVLEEDRVRAKETEKLKHSARNNGAPSNGSTSPGIVEPAPAGNLKSLRLDWIEPNPWQPRQTFDETEMLELVQSILDNGVLQPPVVRAHPHDITGFQIIAGERRVRAARQAGLDRIDCLIRSATDEQMAELAIVENRDRKDVNPIEQAKAYRRLMDEFGKTQQQIADRAGKSQPVIANALRLLELPDGVKEKIANGELSEAHGKALLKFARFPEFLEAYAGFVVEHNIPSKKIEQSINFGEDYAARHTFVSEMRKRKLLISLEAHRAGATNSEMIAASLKEYSGSVFLDSERGTWYLLDVALEKPICDMWKQTAEERKKADKEKSQQSAEKLIEAARKSGKPLKLENVDRQSYAYVEKSDTYCKDCPCRMKGMHYGSEYTVCVDPKSYQAKKTAAAKERNARRREEMNRRLAEITALIDEGVNYQFLLPQDAKPLPVAQPRALVLATLAVLRNVGQDSIQQAAKRLGITFDAVKFSNYATRTPQRLEMLLAIDDQRQLLYFAAEALLHSDLKKKMEGYSYEGLDDFFTAPEQEKSAKDDSTGS